MTQPEGHVVSMAELEIDPKALPIYQSLLTEQIDAAVRLEPGVLMLAAVSIKERPTQIRVLEVYADQEAYEAHLKASHFLNYKAATAEMVRSLNLVETDPLIICSKLQAILQDRGDRPLSGRAATAARAPRYVL